MKKPEEMAQGHRYPQFVYGWLDKAGNYMFGLVPPADTVCAQYIVNNIGKATVKVELE